MLCLVLVWFIISKVLTIMRVILLPCFTKRSLSIYLFYYIKDGGYDDIISTIIAVLLLVFLGQMLRSRQFEILPFFGMDFQRFVIGYCFHAYL